MTTTEEPGTLFSPDAFPCGCMVTGGLETEGVRGIIYANRYLQELTGLTTDELDGRSLSTLFTRAASIMVDTYVIPLVTAEGRCEQILLECLDAAGEKVPVLANAALGENESVIFWSIVSASQRNRLDDELVEARRSLQEQRETLHTLSITDELTGLNNRRELLRCYAGAVERAIRADGPLTVLMIDIDHFKSINDEHGHVEGDRILRELGRMFLKEGRVSDIIGRYGGEEFVFVLEDTDEQKARHAAKRIHRMVARIDPASVIPGITVSIGGAIARDPDAESCNSLLEGADQALYHAKEAGPNTTSILVD